MNAKPAAAFAAGLWIGAVVVAAVALFYLHIWNVGQSGTTLPTTAEQLAKDEEIQALRREQVQLTAEAQRLRQTVADLKSNLETTATEPLSPMRRVPFRAPTPTASESSDDWIAEAVASSDPQVLPRLEEAAGRNNEAALEALALMSDRDNGAALARVWASPSLTPANKVRATRYLAATLESNPHAVEFLESLFSSSTIDSRLIRAAVDGIAKPGVQPTLIANAPAPSSTPQANFELRLQLLDEAAAATTDQSLRDHIDQARDQLLTRWVQAEPASQ